MVEYGEDSADHDLINGVDATITPQDEGEGNGDGDFDDDEG